MFSGPVKFVLVASGHIAGIVNSPAAGKYGQGVNDKTPARPEAWLKTAKEEAGSS